MSNIENTADFALKVVGPPRWTTPDDPPVAAGEPALLLLIDREGKVSVYSGKVEYGQAIQHGFALAVGDQLGVSPADVDVVLADTARVPWDRATVGSASTRTTGVQLGRAAAAARRKLIALAAAHFGVDQKDVALDDGHVRTAASARSASFQELLEDQSIELDIPGDVEPPAQLSIENGSDRGVRVDAVEKVTGKAVYAQDFSVPGMLHGKVIRPPSYGATLRDIDTSRAERVPGFVSFVRDGSFAAVVAESDHSASRAAEAVRARWQEQQDDSSDWNLPALLKDNAGEEAVLQQAGAPDTALESGSVVIEGTYFAPYVSNAQMEPSAAVADWQDGSLTVWCGNRGPFTERTLLAETLGLDEDNIRVVTLAVGGSFGTKTPTVSIEAARMAMAVNRPVKVAYSRSEEFTWSTVRPGALVEVRSAVKPDGKLTSWEYRAYYAGENAFRGRRGAPTPYDVPNISVSVFGSKSPLQYGSYRSLGGATNHFAREVHMDRIARQLEIDPAKFRINNLSHPRYLRVLKQAIESFEWNARNRRDNVGYGMAIGFDAGSYVAQCVEVEVVERQVNVSRVTTAFDCGAMFNPDGVRNQVEGSIMMGIGTALWESVEFDGGRVLNTGFNRYRVPRLMDTPEIEVVLIDDPSNPATGAGEPGIVPIAAAIANAVADATGIEIDQLPIEPQLR